MIKAYDFSLLMRYQLMEDMYGVRYTNAITPEQSAMLASIKNHDLQEEMFLDMTGRNRMIYVKADRHSSRRNKQ